MKRSMVVSFIGRPNVGKSSLFNRVMKNDSLAITHNDPGVTRDRHYGLAKLDENGDSESEDIILVDTGGFYPTRLEEDKKDKEQYSKNKFFNIMADHAKLAVEESDLILFVVDVREGVLPMDETIAEYLRTSRKDFWLIINKYDSDKLAGYDAEFYSLGINPKKMFVVSAAHSLGMTDLLSSMHTQATKFYSKTKEDAPDLQKGVTPREQVISKISIIGAPNAGKSTLLNRLIGVDRALVSDISGTTVDPIEGFFDLYFGEDGITKLNSFKDNHNHEFNKEQMQTQFEDFRRNNKELYQKVLVDYTEETNEDLDGDYIETFESEEEYEDVMIRELELGFSHKSNDKKYSQVFESEDVEDKLEGTERIFETEETKDQNAIDKLDENSFWKSVQVVDTAGIRKKSMVNDFVELQSVYRSLKSISESEIVLYVVDATKGISHQDRRLIDIALEKGKSLIICLNKMDLLKEEVSTEKERKEWLANLRNDVPWLNYCDLLPISAKHNKAIKSLKESIKNTVLVRRQKIPTGELNRFVYSIIDKHSVMLKNSHGKRLRVKYSSMIKSNPPTFILFSNKSQGIPDTYKRYIKNSLRAEYDFINTPVHLIFRTGSDLNRRTQWVSKKKTKGYVVRT